MSFTFSSLYKIIQLLELDSEVNCSRCCLICWYLSNMFLKANWKSKLNNWFWLVSRFWNEKFCNEHSCLINSSTLLTSLLYYWFSISKTFILFYNKQRFFLLLKSRTFIMKISMQKKLKRYKISCLSHSELKS
jgi:hypothetical protein